MTIAIFLNVATFPKHWMGFDPELLERAISVTGSIANYGVQQGWGVGVYANGSVPNSDQSIRVQPSRSPGAAGPRAGSAGRRHRVCHRCHRTHDDAHQPDRCPGPVRLCW
jgi:hypothetical protein